MPCGDRLAWLSLATPSQRPELASVDFNDADAALPADMPLARLAGDLTGERWLTDDTPRDVTIAGWQVRATTHLAMASRFFAEDVIEQVHQVLTGGRLNLPEKQLISALAALSDCDVRLRRSSQGRIQVEKMLHEFASIHQQ